MLAVIEGVKPRDQTEVMLAAQMAVVHLATMVFGGRLARSESIMQSEVAQRALCKIARTFAAQLEALKRNRCNCEHKVTVEEVKTNLGIAMPSLQPSSKSNGQYHAKQNGHTPQPRCGARTRSGPGQSGSHRFVGAEGQVPVIGTGPATALHGVDREFSW
jgi:hypothetical protein